MKQILYLLVAAIGTGCLFQTPMIGKGAVVRVEVTSNPVDVSLGVQAAMPVKDMATATATMGMIR